MIFHRHTMICLVIGAGLLSSALAQDSGSNTGSGGGGAAPASGDSSGNSGSSGVFAPPSSSNSGGSTGTSSGGNDIFAPAPVSGNVTPDTTNSAVDNGASAPTNNVEQAPAPVTVAGAFGSSPVVLQAGAGRFAKKPFKLSLSVTQGYDDNVFSASDQQPPTEVVIPGTPSQTITYDRTIPGTPAVPPKILPGGIIIPGRPAVPPQTVQEHIKIPGTPDQVVQQPVNPLGKPIGSAVTTASLGFTWNLATPRTLFSLQAHGGTNYYWSRPNKKSDYNGSINLVLSHAITPRMRFNAVVDTVYQNNPDFSRLNDSTRNAQGAYYDSNIKLDLTYQWNARFSTDSSYSLNGTYYETSAQKGQNLTQNIFSNDFRFLLSPRTALVASYRYGIDTRPDSTLNDTSQFFLGGFDFSFSSRLNTTLRIGEQLQSLETGRSTSSPYGEMTLHYVYGKGSTINWTNRYGMDSPDANTRSISSFNSGLSVSHVLSARTTLNVGVNWNHRSTDYLKPTTPSLREDYIGGNVTLQYIYTESWSFNVNYNYNQLLSSSDFTSYHRNQIFFGVEYDF
jgi:hypothetical protein